MAKSLESKNVNFTAEDIESFDAEDAHAGRAIGKILALFFLYTVFAMVVSSLATWYYIARPEL